MVCQKLVKIENGLAFVRGRRNKTYTASISNEVRTEGIETALKNQIPCTCEVTWTHNTPQVTKLYIDDTEDDNEASYTLEEQQELYLLCGDY